MDELQVVQGMSEVGYRINGPDVVAQVIEGEALLIAFESGAYYSIGGAGGFVIEAIQRRVPITQIANVLAKSRDAPPASEIQAELTHLVEWLQSEQLIVEDACDDAASAAAGNALRPLERYERIVLEKYTDLEDLLLLDPIHEVDAAGWPVAKAAP